MSSTKNLVNTSEERISEESTDISLQENLLKTKNSEEQQLEMIDRLPIHKRIFRKMEKGSLRFVVISWIRFSLGMGVLSLPFFCSQLGLLGGIVAIIIAAFMFYYSSKGVLLSSIEFGQDNYPDLIKENLPTFISNIFYFTFTWDLSSLFVFYPIITWNVFCNMLVIFGYYKEDWVRDTNTMEFYDYHSEVFLMRVVYFITLYVLSIPFLLKKEIRSLKNISYCFLALYIIFIIYLSIEAPFFRQSFISKGTYSITYLFKMPSLYTFTVFFSMMNIFYVQPYILDMKNMLRCPTKGRCLKVAKTSAILEFAMYTLFGCWIYFCFGDNSIPILIFTRKPYEGKNMVSEQIFRSLLMIYLFVFAIGISVYNPSLRNLLVKRIPMKNKKLQYRLFSLVPFLIGCSICILYPSITGLMAITAVKTIFNAFIIPNFLWMKILKQRKNEYGILFLHLYNFILVIVGILELIGTFNH